MMKQLKVEVQGLEWCNRLQGLEFYRIHESENEDLLTKVNAVAATNANLLELTANEVIAILMFHLWPHELPCVIVRFF